MNPQVLKVYKSPFNKIRLGKNNDGGYIIAEIIDANYTTLISGGLGNDISFEESFIKKYPNVFAILLDGTINSLPRHFIKKNIDHENNLHDLINEKDHIFVKMDIEGDEVPWLNSLNDEQINKFEQMVIEFHHPYYNSKIFEKINQSHYLIHFHGNNCCGVKNYEGVNIPHVFECTYVHKKHFKKIPDLNQETLPSKLDMKNTHRKEIDLNYPPFVNRKWF